MSEAGDGARDDSVTAGTALVVFLLGEGAALVFYMYISRRMWFFMDEWDFLANRTAFNVHSLFEPHNEHWVTLPALAYRGLWWVFGLRTYHPYQLVMVLLHLGLALLLRTLMRRVGVRPWTATLVAWVLVFFGSGYQNIVLPFQITLVGSVVFGVGQLLLAGHDGGVATQGAAESPHRGESDRVRIPLDRRDYLGLAAGVGAIMCSGVGVSMVIAVGVAMLIARGWRIALFHTAPLAALYVVWFAAIGHEGYTGKHGNIGDVAHFVRMIIGDTFSALGHFRGLGLVFGALIVAGLVLAWRPLPAAELRARAAAPVGLLVGAFSLLCITGYGRASLGIHPEKSRYLHLVLAMILPALGVAADAIMRRWRYVTPLVLVVLVAGVPSNVDTIVDYMHRPIVENQAVYRRMMLSLPRVAAATQVPRDQVPEQELAHFVTIGWLLDGVRSGRIPKPDRITPANRVLDTIRLSLSQSPTRLSPTDTCVDLARSSLRFHLEKGQSIIIGGRGKQARIVPVTSLPGDAFPFYPIPVAGPRFTAERPVSFRVIKGGPGFGRVCGKRPLIMGARIAAAR